MTLPLIIATVIMAMKILIVDDDNSLATIISTALEKAGYLTTVAGTGRDGIEKARSEMPDLILLDQVLPDISGNQALSEIKMDENIKQIPVLMLSNFSQNEMVDQAIQGGAEDYIYKYQVEISDIVNKVGEALKAKSEAPPPAETVN